MSINIYLGFLIAFIPLILAFMFARRYNFIHGFITYLFLGTLFVFLIAQFGDKFPASFSDGVSTMTGFSTVAYCFPTLVILDCSERFNMFKDIATQDWFILTVTGVLWVISQIVASIIRHSRISKIRRLKRAAKKY